MRKWLLPGHEYKNNKRFNSDEEHGMAPPWLSSTNIFKYAKKREEYLEGGGAPYGRDDLLHHTRVKRRSTLFNLPYWKVSVFFTQENLSFIFVTFLTGFELSMFLIAYAFHKK